MPRYVTGKRVRSDDDFDWYEPPIITSLEVDEAEPVDTGLLDAEGNSIWRLKDPIGFILHG